jgi:predicted nucleic acid-binding protein
LAVRRFSSDWGTYLTKVPLSPEILDLILGLVNKHYLRGSDAVHLASALWVGQRVEPSISLSASRPLVFATSDKQLAKVAQLEQLNLFDPEDTF